uniref:Pyridoxamine 5'-phosphate oxidase putative domain-containing protein n=1 Tax=Chromera velia CCMP2878 TaxID=1169474 RepID=A0A0G4H8M1_9ALVE|eukprot:Cvel_25194.t1-p1 / transcript=Cvel_25194.t1 / gene=Cvel_25194 / organism=Chromera_velia_CCMP2878 / gene_product=hypothetical protein / transcript_product=hypothetical protein / location=Cvel_scaffold2820:17503-19475(-) / protein_length=297 / sequence_SO=supercontig / SO=protein_coding / is_pseudo=false
MKKDKEGWELEDADADPLVVSPPSSKSSIVAGLRASSKFGLSFAATKGADDSPDGVGEGSGRWGNFEIPPQEGFKRWERVKTTAVPDTVLRCLKTASHCVVATSNNNFPYVCLITFTYLSAAQDDEVMKSAGAQPPASGSPVRRRHGTDPGAPMLPPLPSDCNEASPSQQGDRAGVMIFCTRRDTKKFADLLQNPSRCAVIVHDFADKKTAKGVNVSKDRVAVTLFGEMQAVLDPKLNEQYTRIHEKENPQAAVFIRGVGQVVVKFVIKAMKWSNQKDEVKQWDTDPLQAPDLQRLL